MLEPLRLAGGAARVAKGIVPVTDTPHLPRDRTELLAAVAVSWRAYRHVLDELSDEQWEGPTDAQGWTIKDHVAHVTAWENVVVEVFRSGVPPFATLQIPEADWIERGFASATDLIYAQTSGQSLRRAMRNRDATHVRLVAILEGLTEDELRQPFMDSRSRDGERPVLAAMMEYLVDHYDKHRREIAAMTGTQA
jgi:hypothetical protein